MLLVLVSMRPQCLVRATQSDSTMLKSSEETQRTSVPNLQQHRPPTDTFLHLTMLQSHGNTTYWRWGQDHQVSWLWSKKQIKKFDRGEEVSQPRTKHLPSPTRPITCTVQPSVSSNPTPPLPWLHLMRSICRAFTEAGGLQMCMQETLGFIG